MTAGSAAYGKAELLEADAPLPGRHLMRRNRGKKPFEQHLVDIVARQRRRHRAADQPRPAPEQRHRAFGLGRVGEERLLREAALVPQAVQLPGVDAMACGFEPLLQHARQRQVHVVAAEQDVVADRDALEREVAPALRRRRSG